MAHSTSCGGQKNMRRISIALRSSRCYFSRARKLNYMSFVYIIRLARISPSGTSLYPLIPYGVLLRTSHILTGNHLRDMEKIISDLIGTSMHGVSVFKMKCRCFWV